MKTNHTKDELTTPKSIEEKIEVIEHYSDGELTTLYIQGKEWVPKDTTHTKDISEDEFQQKLRELPDCKELGMEGRYRIIIQGIEQLQKCHWWEFTKKRRINAIIRKAVSNKV